MILKKVTTEEELQLAFDIRKEVFVKEQGVAVDIELDAYDNISTHVLVIHDNKAIATGRVRELDEQAKLQRICVLKEYRGTGVGKLVIEGLEVIARGMKLHQSILHAQYHAKEFYEKLGYTTVSDIFMEQNIEHVTMVKEL